MVEEAVGTSQAAKRKRRIKLLFVVALAVAFVLVNFIMFLYGVEISWHIFLCVFFAFAITSTAAYVYGSKLVGKAVAMALMEYDRDYIGVDVHVGHIDVSLFSGRIDIQHFQVDNPEGYQAEYLFKAERISIDIGMKRLLASRGGLIVIKELSLLKIDAIIEYDGYINALSTTNFETVLDFMKKRGEDRSRNDAPEAPEPAQENLPQETCCQKVSRRCCGKSEAKKESGRKTVVRKVQLIDIGVKIANKFGQHMNNFSHAVAGVDAEAGIAGMRVAVADMEWGNFSEENQGVQSTVDMMSIIIRSLLKTILANIAGRNLAEALF